jgi:uncharacterized membrane protein
MWISHHSMFERIRVVDRGLMFLNLTLLLGIAFVPFPTALLAEYARQGGSNAHWAAVIYSGTMVAIGLSFSAIWAYLAHHHHLLDEDVDPALLRRSVRRSLVGPAVYTASIALAFVNALACFAVYGAMAGYFALGPSARALRSPSADHAHGGRSSSRPAASANESPS